MGDDERENKYLEDSQGNKRHIIIKHPVWLKEKILIVMSKEIATHSRTGQIWLHEDCAEWSLLIKILLIKFSLPVRPLYHNLTMLAVSPACHHEILQRNKHTKNLKKGELLTCTWYILISKSAYLQ